MRDTRSGGTPVAAPDTHCVACGAPTTWVPDGPPYQPGAIPGPVAETGRWLWVGAPLVTDDEAKVVREIVQRQDALDDPYAWHKGIEDFLRGRGAAGAAPDDDRIPPGRDGVLARTEPMRPGDREVAPTVTPLRSAGAAPSEAGEPPRQPLTLSEALRISREMVERVRRNLRHGPLSDEEMIEAEADELVRLVRAGVPSLSVEDGKK